MILDAKFYEDLEQHVRDGWVTARRHPSLPLTNYTYSRKTEMESHWDEITMRTRGLIIDDKKRVIFVCPPKFFNFAQNDIADAVYERMQQTGYKIYEKLDGSAIWVVNDPEYGLVVSSKSSFDSDQVKWAQEIIKEKFTPCFIYFIEGICYAFELIHPENRIVVNYGDLRTLRLWAMITQEGEPIELEDNSVDTSWFEKSLYLGTNKNKEVIDEYLKQDNVEGVVLKGEVFDRLKMKSDTYLELHRIRTECTPKRIWEILAQGKRIEDYDFPDEFINDLKVMQAFLLETYSDIDKQARLYADVYSNLSDAEFGSMKPTASHVYQSLVFMIRKEQKDRYEKMIWNHIGKNLSEILKKYQVFLEKITK